MSDSTLLTIGRAEVSKAMGDPEFLKEFPEFRTMKNKAEMLSKTAGGGCSSCRQGRIVGNLTLEFLNILAGLDQDRVAAIKGYFKADKLVYTAFDKLTGVYRTSII